LLYRQSQLPFSNASLKRRRLKALAHNRKDRGQPTGIRHRHVPASCLPIKAPEFARHLTYGGQAAYSHFPASSHGFKAF
jgi:hypothetical protein